jgi:amino acid transporter
MTAYIIIAYAIIGLIIGYLIARSSYNDPENRDCYHKGGWCTAQMIVFGATWPIIVGGVALFMFFWWLSDVLSDHNLGRKFFGGNS